jgi:tetratricopeptide (TPR) repeat protein
MAFLSLPFPTWLARAAVVFSLVAGATPLALAVARRDEVAGSAALMVTTGGLVSAQFLMYSLVLRRLTRFLRSRERVQAGLRTALSLGLVASPLGGWVAERWLGVDVLTGATGAVVLPGVLLGVRAAQRVTGRHRLPGMAMSSRLARLANSLSRFGLVPFFLACVARPDRALLIPALSLVATEGLTFSVTTVVRFPTAAALREARFIAALAPELRAVRLEDWLQDAFLAHPGKPDYVLVHGLCGGIMGNLGLRGVPPSGAPEHQAALADEALDLVETRLVPIYPAEHLEVLRRRHARARSHLAANRGNLSKFQTRYEQALVHWRESVELDAAIPAPNHAAMMRASIATLLAVELGSPEAAAPELTPALDDDRLLPFTRRFALGGAALTALQLDDLASVDRILAEMRRLPVRNRDIAATLREVDLVYGRWVPREEVRGMRAELERLERRLVRVRQLAAGADAEDLELILEEPLLESAAGRLALPAHDLWLAGHPRQAEILLTRAVEIATTADDPIWLFRAHRDLGGIKLLDDGQPLEAYEHLEQAIAVLEGVRAGVLDPDLRVGIAGQAGDTYLMAVVALVALVRQGERPPQLADGPARLAFHVAERMRSRVLLELLAGTPTAASPGKPLSFEEIRALLTG